MKLQYALDVRAASARGQDRVGVLVTRDHTVFVLADGAGGQGGGAAAADSAVKTALQAAESARFCLHAVFSRIEMAVAGTGGLTTLLLVMVQGREISGISCGDSEAWLISDTAVNALTSRQIRRPLVGEGSTGIYFAHRFEGKLLLASDGLIKYTPQQKILEVVRNLEPLEACAQLLRLPELRSGALPDDVGVVVAAPA